METWLPILIQLVSGAVGGNIAGNLMKDQSLGTIGNSISGIVGGGLGGIILNAVGVAVSGGSIDVQSIVGSIAGGGVGGAVIMIIVGIIKKAIGK